MDLVKCGAVNNLKKGSFPGKSIAIYAHGSRQLMKCLDGNPVVEFHPIDVVSDSELIGKNDKMIAVNPARKLVISL